jgi:outer membrane protein TolC
MRGRSAGLHRALVCATALLLLALQPGPALAKRLSLHEAVARARGNPLAQAALAQWRAAEARAGEARAARFPRGELTAFIAPSPKIRCLDADCNRTDPTEASLSNAGVFGGFRVGVLQPLYTFGKIDAAVDAAQSSKDASRALAAGVTGDVTLDTARAYLAVDSARELKLTLEEGGQELVKGRQGIAERIAEGDTEVTLLDRLRLETLEAEVRVRSSEARETEASSLTLLRALVGAADADTEHEPPEPLAFELGDSQSYTRRSRAARPELQAARDAVLALQAATRLEQARWFPDVFAFGGFEFSRAQGVDNPPSAFANDPFNETTAQLGLVLRWSVDPAQAARVSRAKAELDRGKAMESAAGRAGDAAVLAAYARAVEAHERLLAARDGERSARGWVASALQADAVGVASAKDLGDAYIAYFTLRSRVLESIYAWNVAVLTLRRAIGEPVLPPRH